jgi:hypothetical protein
MIAKYTSRTARRAHAIVVACLAAGAVVACGSGDLLVGDDSRDDAAITSEAGTDLDAPAPGEKDSSTADVKTDGPAGACASAPSGPGMCLAKGAGCRQADTTGLTCPTAGDFCCTLSCPSIAQPPPGFCDGGPSAPTYDATACIVGFACAPVSCTTAGGTCVGLAPSACPTGHIGDATKYSCGAGVGVACCLPGK